MGHSIGKDEALENFHWSKSYRKLALEPTFPSLAVQNSRSAHVTFLFHQRSTLQLKIVGHLDDTANRSYTRVLTFGRRSSVDMTAFIEKIIL